ncbi:thyrostimulin alpha-2 subunit isoform X2 [Diprion similis]|nr:thyrostimulin alpha-2 subunit isoform X2 [Diprion similis]
MGSSDYCWCRWTSVMRKTRKRVIYFLLLVFCTVIIGQEIDTDEPQCLLVGHHADIPGKDCPGMTRVGINVCSGYCWSGSFPTPLKIRSNKYPRPITMSRASCCSIKDYENFTTTIQCGTHTQKVTVPSATSCWCHDCINS